MSILKGSLVACVTPMTEKGEVDYAAIDRLVEWHLSQGTTGIVAVGTTGETATLSLDEHVKVIEAFVKAADKRLPIIAGTGANNTQEAIMLNRAAERLGADMSLSVVPYYNKPSQEGIYQHFKAISDNSSIPTIAYNVPGRTVVDMSNDTALRVAELEHIVGLKDATGNIARACDLVRRAPEDFALYSGDDSTAMAFMLCGGDGVITVTGNVAPKKFAAMCRCALDGDVKGARKLNDELQALHRDMFCESSPAPAKWALKRLGLCLDNMRLPAVPLTEKGQQTVESAMRAAGVI